LQASLQVVSSVSLLSFVLLFGVIANAVYFLFSIMGFNKITRILGMRRGR
jgi:hypothetical protein